MAQLAVIHFQPIERYPPVTNLVAFLAKRYPDDRILLVTTCLTEEGNERFCFDYTNVRIVRIGVLPRGSGVVRRMMHYFAFNLAASFRMIFYGPASLFYFETLSAFPAWIVKTLTPRTTKIYVHYHEYTSPDEYKNGMTLVRWLHSLERRMYPGMSWISHTNRQRLEFFQRDEDLSESGILHVMPNYPPLSWRNGIKRDFSLPLKIVYVGALSRETMFLDDFTNWVRSRNGDVEWDIYSDNVDKSARLFLSSIDCQYIKYQGSVSYSLLPEILSRYHIGVILYKGHIPNYVFNAPNKLFEYLACGLDVWFPDIMEGSMPYVRDHVIPRITALDFGRLTSISLEKILDRQGLPEAEEGFFAERVYEEIGAALRLTSKC